MNFSKFKDIHEFYRITGMDRYEAFEFLKKQLERGNKNEMS